LQSCWSGGVTHPDWTSIWLLGDDPSIVQVTKQWLGLPNDVFIHKSCTGGLLALCIDVSKQPNGLFGQTLHNTNCISNLICLLSEGSPNTVPHICIVSSWCTVVPLLWASTRHLPLHITPRTPRRTTRVHCSGAVRKGLRVVHIGSCA